VTYTARDIKDVVNNDTVRLFAPWAVGRPEGWQPDSRTKDIVCVAAWMDEELRRLHIDDEGRKIQLWYFNRWTRSVDDVFEVAAEAMNAAVEDRIDRQRNPHKRWG
jgi:hypothetical protein